MKIAIDIDSTLHHYWDALAAAARRRFGVALPYEQQVTWAIDRLRPEQLRACIAETHSEHVVLAAEPYPGAVDVVRRWHEAGHWIHITSHRDTAARDATARWLERIDLPYDDLHCSYDKIARARELGIDVLVDDSPVNLLGAIEAGMVGATIVHPWNRDVVEEEDVVAARDWDELERKLQRFLA
jgi:uncharacterized protein